MLKNLFEPLKTGSLYLKNRITLSPMGIGSYNSDETITEEYIDFIKARAKGTALVITTGTRVTEKYGKYRVNGCYSDKFIPGLRKLSSAAQSKGAKIFLQIMALGPADPEEPFVPSLDIDDYADFNTRKIKPKQLSGDQVEELVHEFITAAVRAKEAGFDGVELFGSEDGLISSFICPHFNKRDDIYGGNLENRLRFPVEIISGIKKECGDGFPVGFKFNAIYNIDNGIDFSHGIEIAKRIKEAGACYIHCWSFESFEKPMSTYRYPPMPNLYQPRNSLVEISRKYKNGLKDIAVMTVGGILKAKEADSIIKNGDADIVAVGRGFIAENLWAFKAQHSITQRPCIRCHVCHNEVAFKGNIIACSVNPDVLSRQKIKKAKINKRITIVGGGPAGMSAAITAATRGHDVTIIEKEQSLGGKLIAGSAPEFKYEFKDLLNYLKAETINCGVNILLGCNAAGTFVMENMPDAIILAIGALPKFPAIPGLNKRTVYTAVSALNNHEIFAGQNVTVIGGGDVGCETALFLKNHGCREVAIVEIMENLMLESIEHNSIILKQMLSAAGVIIYLHTEVTSIEKDRLFLKNIKGGIAEIKNDFVIIATGYYIPENEINGLRSCNIMTYTIGDCVKPANLREAISDGYNVGLKV